MSDLNKKLSKAKEDYEAAQAALKIARDHYEDGPQKDYAGVKTSIADLKIKINEHEAALATARESLTKELRASKGATTTTAKNSLNDRRNCEELIAECEVILSELEKQEYELRFIISKAATDYRTAYARAAECWALVNTYTVLVECGERLCKAMAVRPWHGVQKVGDAHTRLLRDDFLSRNVIQDEMGRLLENYRGDTQPYLSELGPYDLGVFSFSEIMSPAQMHMAKF